MKKEPVGKKYCPGHDVERHQLHMDRVIEQMISSNVSDTDPNGSYTGKPLEYGEKPVQDADDL